MKMIFLKLNTGKIEDGGTISSDVLRETSATNRTRLLKSKTKPKRNVIFYIIMSFRNIYVTRARL